MNNQEFNPIKATILSNATTTLDKSNGGKYQLHNARIEEGPMKGMLVTANRTILNADGEEKDSVVKGQSVILYPSVVEDSRGKKPFFSVSTQVAVTDDIAILAALGA